MSLSFPFSFYSLLVALLCFQFSCDEPRNAQPLSQEPVLHIFYTGNLSGALEDCGCSPGIAGGMSRVSPYLRKFREQHPNTILIDAGDFLTSYTLPEVNRLMVDFVRQTGYDAVNLGDQEFVEKLDFILPERNPPADKIPFVSGNIQHRASRSAIWQPVRTLSRNGISMRIIGLVSSGAFEFIREDAILVSDPASVLVSLAPSGEEDELQLVLFHGDLDEAKKLMAHFTWIDIMIMGHNQSLHISYEGGGVLCESGLEGEHIGHLSVFKTSHGWHFENEFVPVTRDLPFDPEMQRQVDEYNRTISIQQDSKRN